MSTERDYADMVDPYVRAELAAWERGYDKGVVAGILYAIGIGIVVGMILFASKAGAATWASTESWITIRASDVGAKITVCQPNPKPLGPTWLCYAGR